MSHSIKDFYPLIDVLAVVILLTALISWSLNLDLMLAFMGSFFLVFGGLKAWRLKGFVSAYQMYDVVAMRSKIYAYGYPFLEIGFGLAYILAWQVRWVSVLVVIVMIIGAWGVFKKLRQREEIPCACLGTVFKVPMTWVTLVEDILMALMAGVLIFQL